MFSNRVIAELKTVIGFRNWDDPTEIPALPTSLTDTDSGQYYQDYHGLVRLDYISALLRPNQLLEDYLDEAVTGAINMMLTDVALKKELSMNGKTLVNNDLIYHNVIRGDSIVNESKFVGVEFVFDGKLGIKAVLNRIGLYFTALETINLYLFNSLQAQAVATVAYANGAVNSFQWITANLALEWDKGVQGAGLDTSGGVWYLGYYQDDLAGQAVKYKTLDWRNGYCTGCGNKASNDKYRSISKHVQMTPFYIPASAVPVVGEMFDIDDVRYDYNNNYGFNFNISVVCDLSQFWIDNKLNLKNAIGTYVVGRIINDYVYSSQSSSIEQNVQDLAFEVLNGNTTTKASTFEKRKESAIKEVMLDNGNVNNSPCIPCANNGIKITWS
jgi:hypothetical protein